MSNQNFTKDIRSYGTQKKIYGQQCEYIPSHTVGHLNNSLNFVKTLDHISVENPARFNIIFVTDNLLKPSCL